MHRLLILATFLTVINLVSAQAPSTDEEKTSYMIGFQIGTGLVDLKGEVIMAMLMKGMEASINEAEPAISMEEMQALSQALSTKMRTRSEARQGKEGGANLTAGEAFLKENASAEGWKSTESGLQYKVVKAAQGAKPKATDKVTVHYRGKLLDGTEFDSSYKRDAPATFGLNQVIAGWTEGVQLMSVGSTYTFAIHPKIAYGERGRPGIPPNSVLLFDIELISIN
ncbi:MAG: FKBP-type peptidyl-prolyl cis-trans isomerase FkpA [Rhodothermales bacterium]|jgi:FKBP-type peptidyl-prolyl cis-trans isomerase FkpA